MTDTYALTIHIESYEYRGEYYILGEGHATASEVLQHVAADHIAAITVDEPFVQYLLDLLEEGKTVGKDEYEGFDADIECSLYVDTYYQKFSFGTGERQVELGRRPSRSHIETVSENLDS